MREYRYYNTIRGGNLYRDSTNTTSYKIMLSAEGRGKAFSVVSGITILSLGIPLFMLVPFLVDIVMICFSSSKMRSYN